MSSTSPGPSRGRLGRNKFALGLNLTTAFGETRLGRVATDSAGSDWSMLAALAGRDYDSPP